MSKIFYTHHDGSRYNLLQIIEAYSLKGYIRWGYFQRTEPVPEKKGWIFTTPEKPAGFYKARFIDESEKLVPEEQAVYRNSEVKLRFSNDRSQVLDFKTEEKAMEFIALLDNIKLENKD